MPIVPFIPLIAAGVAGTTEIVSAKMQGSAAKRAGQSASETVRQQIDWEREQDTLNRADKSRYEDEMRRQWDAEQQQLAEDRLEEQRRYSLEFNEERGRYLAKEARLQPYRKAGTASINRLADVAAKSGITLRPLGGTLPPGMPGAPGAAPAQLAQAPPSSMSLLVPTR